MATKLVKALLFLKNSVDPIYIARELPLTGNKIVTFGFGEEEPFMDGFTWSQSSTRSS
jgi:hypothetical protein